MGAEVQVCKLRYRNWLYNSVSVLNTTELYTLRNGYGDKFYATLPQLKIKLPEHMNKLSWTLYIIKR